MSEISIRAEELFSIAHWPITNALLLSCVALGILIIFAVVLRTRMKMIPGKLQSITEIVLEEILSLMDSVLGTRRLSETYLPLIATIFLFIMTSNWLGLLPGVGTIGLKHVSEGGVSSLIPLLRSPSSDLNFALALAVISVLSVNIFGTLVLGIKSHISKYLNFSSPINFFIGILEFIAECVKIVSFSFRLFGNVFAGEVLLTIIAVLSPYLLPLPFLFLELFVGFIQAFIFSMLTLVFISMAVQEHEAH